MDIHTKENSIDIDNNPWAGLASYKDPATTKQKLKFCGRDDDSYDLTKLITLNTFVTLYGKSGIGKTSLLNAGVFPELRKEQYTPVSLRLGMIDDEKPQSYQTIILESVKQSVYHIENQDVFPAQDDQQSIDYLWKYFASHRFCDKDERPTTPVIVFDQFEEVFRSNREETEMLLRQLDNCVSNSSSHRYDLNVRFVISIREDDLYRLEDSIDNCYLPSLKRCRYRLRSLSEEGARDAILIPGKNIFSDEEKNQISETIIQIARNKEDKSISTNLLSLICNRLYVESRKKGSTFIRLSLVDSFVKGNPFERFYTEATRGFSNREKSYIEEHFVDSTGRRNSIPESDFLIHVKNGAKLFEGEKRILQRISTSNDGNNYRVELIHDSFCEPLAVLKGKRERKQRLYWFSGVVAIALLCIGITSCILYQMHRINKQEGTIEQQLASLKKTNQGLLISQARVLAAEAIKLDRDGDSYLSRMLALEALPPNRPYTVEAENALREACLYDNAILRGHTDIVLYADYSHNNNIDCLRIASASADKTIRIWDGKTGKQLGQPLEGHEASVNSVCFSPNGNLVVSASLDKTIRIWDVNSGKQVNEPLIGHTGAIYSAVFSPNGKYIASASADNTIRIWNLDSESPRGMTLKGHTGAVCNVAFSSDNMRVVSASVDKTIRIWDVTTGKPIGQPLKGHSDIVTSAIFISNDKYIVSASADGSICFWDPNTGHQTLKPLKGHQNIINSISYCSDNNQLLSASVDGTICIWNADNGQIIDKPLMEYSGEVCSAVFSPDGQSILYTLDDKTVRILDRSPNYQTKTIFENSRIEILSVDFSPDNSHVVSAASDGIIRILNLRDGTFISLKGHKGAIKTATYSTDGQRIVSASNDSTVRVWDVKNNQKKDHLVLPHNNIVVSAHFSRDSKYIVSVSDDDTIRIWDAITGKPINKFSEGNHCKICSATFSPNSQYVLSTSSDNTIRIWNTNTGQQHGKPMRGHTGYIHSTVYSPDGALIASASADKTIQIWDSAGNKIGSPLEGHTKDVKSVFFSHDGNCLVSASSDGTIRLWDVKNKRQIGQPLVGHKSCVNAVSFSPDSKRIVSASSNGVILIWDFIPFVELIKNTRERFKNRHLTPEERRKHYLEDFLINKKSFLYF